MIDWNGWTAWVNADTIPQPPARFYFSPALFLNSTPSSRLLREKKVWSMLDIRAAVADSTRSSWGPNLEDLGSRIWNISDVVSSL